MIRSLLDFNDWSAEQVHALFETADVMCEVQDRPVKKVPALQGMTICTAFFENSTRTRLSFELAARRMSADVVTFAAGSSSLSKGESLRDTIETLGAMRIDAFIVRHPTAGGAHLVERYAKKTTINAGDGRRAHPTQALLDAYTLRERFGSLEGHKIAIIGDIQHSRVARSNAQLLSLLGATVTLCGPVNLLPSDLVGVGIQFTSDPREAVCDASAVMALRLQQERMSGAFLGSLEEYISAYQVNSKLLALARKDAVVMHPGPMNRDVEISGEVADGPGNVILRQVEHGLPIRMSVLYHLLVGRNR